MANTKLELFERVGTYVYGSRFVGRTGCVKRLQEECTTRNFSIVGLPKIGKTSLAYHSVFYENKQVALTKNHKFCPIFVNISGCENSKTFYKSLVRDFYRSALSLLQEEDSAKLSTFYNLVKEENYDREEVQGFFVQGVHCLPLDVVLLLDEFDKVRSLGFSSADFGVLRNILSVENVHAIVVSRRSIKVLESLSQDNVKNPSTFHDIFKSTTINLKQFNHDDMDAYWARLNLDFSNIGCPLDEEFKKCAIYYTGYHPYLLDLYCSNIFDGILYEGKFPEILNIRTKISDSFDSEREILNDEGLLDSIIQTVIGPVYKLSKEELDRLKEYDVIRPISLSDKDSIMGVTSGYTEINADDSETAFIARSDYYSLLYKNRFMVHFDFWDEWTKTFKSLRRLCEKLLVDNFGLNWNAVVISDSRLAYPVQGMKSFYQKDVNNGLSTSPLIEYLTETLMRAIITNCWSTFSKVFDPYTQIEFFRKYEYLLNIRNHHAHVNDRFLSDDDRKQANDYLRNILEKIDYWFVNNKEGKLLLSQVQTLTGLSGCVVDDPRGIRKIRNGINLYKIDLRHGYADGYSNTSFMDGTYVAFDLKQVSKTDGSIDYYAINISPF